MNSLSTVLWNIILRVYITMHLHPVQFNFLIKYEVKECPFTRYR